MDRKTHCQLSPYPCTQNWLQNVSWIPLKSINPFTQSTMWQTPHCERVLVVVWSRVCPFSVCTPISHENMWIKDNGLQAGQIYGSTILPMIPSNRTSWQFIQKWWRNVIDSSLGRSIHSVHPIIHTCQCEGGYRFLKTPTTKLNCLQLGAIRQFKWYRILERPITYLNRLKFRKIYSFNSPISSTC